MTTIVDISRKTLGNADGLEGLVHLQVLKEEVRMPRNIVLDVCMKVKASDRVRERRNDAAHGGYNLADLDATHNRMQDNGSWA